MLVVLTSSKFYRPFASCFHSHTHSLTHSTYSITPFSARIHAHTHSCSYAVWYCHWVRSEYHFSILFLLFDFSTSSKWTKAENVITKNREKIFFLIIWKLPLNLTIRSMWDVVSCKNVVLIVVASKSATFFNYINVFIFRCFCFYSANI